MTKTYHKIPTVFKRNPDTKFATLLDGQYATPELEYLADCQWEWTEKVDGTNIRVMFDRERITFGGKTDKAQLSTLLLTRLEQRFLHQLPLFRANFSDGVCLYCEGYGPGIQKGGGKYRNDQDVVLFDVWVGDWWLKRPDVEDVATKLGCNVVPVVGIGTLPDLTKRVGGGFVSRWGDFEAEGIVARPLVELTSRNGERIITKLKCKDFA